MRNLKETKKLAKARSIETGERLIITRMRDGRFHIAKNVALASICGYENGEYLDRDALDFIYGEEN
jgi:hypothetical protein